MEMAFYFTRVRCWAGLILLRSAIELVSEIWFKPVTATAIMLLNMAASVPPPRQAETIG